MENYFNYKQTDNVITYEPYLYDKSNNNKHLFLGVLILITGIVLYYSGIWKEGVPFIIIFGGIGMINGFYRVLIGGKIQIEFNKSNDTMYKITPLGKWKKISLSNIYNIVSVSENSSYTYHITRKDKPNSKSINISCFIDNNRLTKPEFQFIENNIIPALITFLQLGNQKNSSQINYKHYPK